MKCFLFNVTDKFRKYFCLKTSPISEAYHKDQVKVTAACGLLKEMFQGAFSLNPKFTYSGHEVFVNGDIAVHIAPWTMKGQAPDGSEVKQEGLSIAVLRKQKDGKWLMVFDDPHGQFLMKE